MVWKDLAFVPTGKVASQSLLTQTKVNATTFTWTNSFVTGKGPHGRRQDGLYQGLTPPGRRDITAGGEAS